MKHSIELNTRTLLTRGALFSCVYILLLFLAINYFSNIYSIGKFDVWPFGALLIIGEVLKYIITSKRDQLVNKEKYSKNKKSAKFKFGDLFKCGYVFLGMTFVYYVVAVLFGAPVFTEKEETFMFALLLTILTILPSILNLGPTVTLSLLSSVTAYDGDMFTDIHIICIRCVLFGAWLGAIVIPLDWDRPWQAWPIPCSIGALLGYIASQIFIVFLNVPKIGAVFEKKSRKFDL